MLPFQKKKLLKLVYGDQVLDMNNPNVMKKLMTVRKAAAIVGVKE